MDIAALNSWLDTTSRELCALGVKVTMFQSHPGMDPDFVLNLESDEFVATIGVWSALEEAELDAVSADSEGMLVFEHVSLLDNDFDAIFQPILRLFRFAK